MSRELTKIYEENIRGTAEELLLHFESKKIKGEIVVVIDKVSKKKMLEYNHKEIEKNGKKHGKKKKPILLKTNIIFLNTMY